jgi:anti-sigma-K factor RskA
MYRLPQTPEGMEYQLWVLREGKPTSVGTFTVAEDGSAMLKLKALPTPTEIASFEVTIEPEGGMPQPTGMMYLTGPDSP